MKATFFTFLINTFILCHCKLNGQSPTGSLLWEVSGNGLKTPSYIYGTIHLIESDFFSVSSQTDSVFNLCSQLALEIKLDDPTILPTFQKWSILPDSKLLSNYCDSIAFNKIKTYFLDSLQVDIMTMLNVKPFLLTQLQVSHQTKGDQNSYDMYFYMQGIKMHKNILGLELLAAQLHVFDSIPYTEQLEWIAIGIDAIEDNNATNEKMISAYLNGDLNALDNLINNNSPEITKYKNLFLTDRNKNWIPVIRKYISENPTFIAVGAGHLAGEDGILQLLINEGYTIKPL